MAAKFEKALQSAEARQRADFLRELQQVRTLLDRNEVFFNMTSDPDLTDYAIHERSALLARYRYLLQAIRQLDQVSPADSFTQKERKPVAI